MPPQPQVHFFYFASFLSCRDTLLFPGPQPSISYRFGRIVKENQLLPIRSIITRLDATTGFLNLLRHCPTWLTRIIGYKSPIPGPRSHVPLQLSLEVGAIAFFHLSSFKFPDFLNLFFPGKPCGGVVTLRRIVYIFHAGFLRPTRSVLLFPKPTPTPPTPTTRYPSLYWLVFGIRLLDRRARV